MLIGQSALPSILNSFQTSIVLYKQVSHILAEWAGFQICIIFVLNTIGNRLTELNPTRQPHCVSEKYLPSTRARVLRTIQTPTHLS